MVGELIGVRVQLMIGELLLTQHDGHRLGHALCLRLKQLVETAICRIRRLRVIPLD